MLLWHRVGWKSKARVVRRFRTTSINASYFGAIGNKIRNEACWRFRSYDPPKSNILL